MDKTKGFTVFNFAKTCRYSGLVETAKYTFVSEGSISNPFIVAITLLAKCQASVESEFTFLTTVATEGTKDNNFKIMLAIILVYFYYLLKLKDINKKFIMRSSPVIPAQC